MKSTTVNPVIYRLEIVSKLLAIIGAISGTVGIFMLINQYEIEIRDFFILLRKKLVRNPSDQTINSEQSTTNTNQQVNQAIIPTYRNSQDESMDSATSLTGSPESVYKDAVDDDMTEIPLSAQHQRFSSLDQLSPPVGNGIFFKSTTIIESNNRKRSPLVPTNNMAQTTTINTLEMIQSSKNSANMAQTTTTNLNENISPKNLSTSAAQSLELDLNELEREYERSQQHHRSTSADVAQITTDAKTESIGLHRRWFSASPDTRHKRQNSTSATSTSGSNNQETGSISSTPSKKKHSRNLSINTNF